MYVFRTNTHKVCVCVYSELCMQCVGYSMGTLLHVQGLGICVCILQIPSNLCALLLVCGFPLCSLDSLLTSVFLLLISLFLLISVFLCLGLIFSLPLCLHCLHCWLALLPGHACKYMHVACIHYATNSMLH